jgi:hypothetical protein
MTLEEAEILAEALRKHKTWLGWAGRDGKKSFQFTNEENNGWL